MILKNKLKELNYNEVALMLLFLYLGITFFSVALSNICLGIACFIFVLGVVAKQIHFKGLDFKMYLAIVSPFILTFVSTISSTTYSAGLGYLNLRLPILIIPYIILCLSLEKKHLKKAFSFLVLAAILASLVTFFNAVKYFNQDMLFQTDFTYFITVIHHPYFGIYVLLSIIGLLEFNVIKNNYLKVFIVVFLSLAISLTTSRIVYMLYFLALCFYSRSKLPLKYFRYSVIVVGCLLSLFVISNKNIKSKFVNSLNYNKSPRLKLWTNSLEVIEKSDSYVFGIGIGDFYKEKKDVYFGHNYGNSTKGEYGYNPHSQLVEFYVTNGLLGVTIILIALSYYLFMLKKQNNFALSVFTIIFLFSLVECIFNRQYGVQLYSVFIPLLASGNFKRK